MKKRKKIIVIILMLLTLALAAVSVYIGLKVSQENQQPASSGASTQSEWYNTCLTPVSGCPSGLSSASLNKWNNCWAALNPCDGQGWDTYCSCTGGPPGTIQCNGNNGTGPRDFNPTQHKTGAGTNCVVNCPAVSKVQFRVGSGAWQTAAQFNAANHTIPLSGVSIRCVDGSNKLLSTRGSASMKITKPNNTVKTIAGSIVTGQTLTATGTYKVQCFQGTKECKADNIAVTAAPNTATCNEACGTSSTPAGATCSGTGQSCVDTGSGAFKCRLTTDPTSTTCVSNLCGNGTVDTGEECDDGNTVNTDSCDNTCHTTTTTVACNEACNGTTLLCNSGAGQSCISGVCRLTANPDSETCQPATGEPVFTIVKSYVPVCNETNGNLVITYTVRVTNTSDVEGVITQVIDTYDPQIDSLGLTVSAITPSFGVKSGGTITWVGSVSQRTFAAGQSKTYTYKVTIPTALKASISNNDLNNQVKVQYDTATTSNNEATYTLRTPISCELPNTALFDKSNRYIIFGLMLVTLAYTIYKFKIGVALFERLGLKFYVGGASDKGFENKVLSRKPKKRKR